MFALCERTAAAGDLRKPSSAAAYAAYVCGGDAAEVQAARCDVRIVHTHSSSATRFHFPPLHMKFLQQHNNNSNNHHQQQQHSYIAIRTYTNTDRPAAPQPAAAVNTSHT